MNCTYLWCYLSMYHVVDFYFRKKVIQVSRLVTGKLNCLFHAEIIYNCMLLSVSPTQGAYESYEYLIN